MNPNETYEEYIRRMRKLQVQRIRARARMKQRRIAQCSIQAKYAKARLIEKGKGKNGKSMSKELLEAHLAIR